MSLTLKEEQITIAFYRQKSKLMGKRLNLEWQYPMIRQRERKV